MLIAILASTLAGKEPETITLTERPIASPDMLTRSAYCGEAVANLSIHQIWPGETRGAVSFRLGDGGAQLMSLDAALAPMVYVSSADLVCQSAANIDLVMRGQGAADGAGIVECRVRLGAEPPVTECAPLND